jgi:hypothetical protein
MKNKGNAPVALFVYNRLQHTRETVEALKNNDLAEETELIVFSDGPKIDEHSEAVDCVRAYLRNISGFKKITVVERTTNYGLARSIIDGVTEVCNGAGRVVVLEDDIVVSPFFLDYVNSALRVYENQEDVLSIGCYTFPVKLCLPETFFFRVPDCWGWAVWKRSWDLFNPDGKELLEAIKAKGLEKEFDLNGAYPYCEMLAGQIAGKNDSWAIRWYATALIHNRLTLYPGRSMTFNIGMDGTGIHCGPSSDFRIQLAQAPNMVQKIPVEENKEACESIAAFLKSQQNRGLVGLQKRLANILSRFSDVIKPII